MSNPHPPSCFDCFRVIAAMLVAWALALVGLPILAEGATADLFVPIVLSSGGAAGSFYTTELTLANRGTTPATIEVKYTAAFGGGSGRFREPLQPGEQKVIPDAIAFLVARGLPLPATGDRGGTLQLTFYDLSSPDAAAVTARTTTATVSPQPEGAAGLALGLLGRMAPVAPRPAGAARPSDRAIAGRVDDGAAVSRRRHRPAPDRAAGAHGLPEGTARHPSRGRGDGHADARRPGTDAPGRVTGRLSSPRERLAADRP